MQARIADEQRRAAQERERASRTADQLAAAEDVARALARERDAALREAEEARSAAKAAVETAAREREVRICPNPFTCRPTSAADIAALLAMQMPSLSQSLAGQVIKLESDWRNLHAEVSDVILQREAWKRRSERKARHLDAAREALAASKAAADSARRDAEDMRERLGRAEAQMTRALAAAEELGRQLSGAAGIESAAREEIARLKARWGALGIERRQ